MEPSDPSFADEFNVPQKDAVLVFDVCRAAVSLLFQVHRLKVLLEAGLIAFTSACFEFANEVPKEAQHGSLAHFPKVFSNHLHGLSKIAVVGFCAPCQHSINYLCVIEIHGGGGGIGLPVTSDLPSIHVLYVYVVCDETTGR